MAREEGIQDWPKAKRVVVPVRMYGMLVTWVARSYNGAKPKTITPKREDVGSGPRWAIGGYDEAEVGGVINTTESWANRLRLKQAGWSNPLSLCGSDLTEERVLAIMALKPAKIIHWIDGDAAGRRLARDIADVVGTKFAYEVVDLGEDKDVADHRPSEVRSMKPVAWSDHKQVPTRERS
jgi:5S rRNA maturation endonuclease (ribonuclease M5)